MATVTEDVVETDAGDKRGIRPNHMIIGLWTGVAVITAVSGIAAAVFEFHHEEGAITREVFGNIPTPIKAMFYALIPTLLIYVGFQLSFRVKNWQRGAPENRKTTKKNVKQRLADMRAGLYMQTLMRDPIAGIMHSMIYFGFLILMAVTTTLEIDHQLPESLKFLDGGVYKGYALVGDAAGLMFFAGLMWALGRRLGPRSMRPYRIRIKNKPEHFVILGTLLAISISGFGAEAFRIALDQQNFDNGLTTVDPSTFEQWSFIGYPLSLMVDGMGSLSGWHQAWWIAHVISFALFLIILPTTMLRHMVTSPANMYLKDRDRPKGAMKPMANLMETEMESFGASVVEDFTWKQLMDTDSCTMCGRCTAVCPASATGKSLDPREIVLKTGEVMARSGTPQVSPPIGVDKEIALANEPGNILVAPNNVFDRITSEEIWACTTCKACDENCPVNIEILDKILDMRRYLSLMESDFPTELGNAYRAMENQGNPWGMGQGERADWAAEFEGLEVLDGGDPMTAEYLYWVGCAGSFDDKNKKVSQAFSKLMDRAGVSFAILGPSEMCTGDPARRSGNEYIFQMLAMQNIETLNTMGVKKIVAQCPHCFNTLANEYPQLGGHYEVVHHSQLLEDLIDSGKLDVTNATLEDRLVYHDSCYLGRHNDVYLSPRNVVGSIGGIQVVEAERNGTKGMCCGAGGARMWMEEHVGKQINVERSQELLATGATRIATACPFCYVMIDDGIKGEGVEDGEVLVQDIAMHLLDAIEEGEANLAANNPLLTPTADRVTATDIEMPLGFGMHGDLDGDGIKETDAAPSPIAALLSDIEAGGPDGGDDDAVDSETYDGPVAEADESSDEEE